VVRPHSQLDDGRLLPTRRSLDAAPIVTLDAGRLTGDSHQADHREGCQVSGHGGGVLPAHAGQAGYTYVEEVGPGGGRLHLVGAAPALL
jgi:hypothetical protein